MSAYSIRKTDLGFRIYHNETDLGYGPADESEANMLLARERVVETHLMPGWLRGEKKRNES